MRNYEKLFRKRLEDYNYIIAKEQPLSFATENLQKAILNIEFANVDHEYKVIQITSTSQSEGKTTILSNLTYLLAQRGKKVLVIDLDLRRPKLHKVVKVANENGLNDFLLGEKTKEEVIQKSNEFNFDFIVSGQTTTAITNALMSNKLAQLLQELKNDYDYIFVDTPPTFVVSDAYYIAKIVDGIIYVIGQNIARKKDIKDGLNELNRMDAKIIGVLLSQVKVKNGKYYYYYGD